MKFKDIKGGDYFVWKSNLYFKRNAFYAWMVCNGCVLPEFAFNKDDEVEPVDIEVKTVKKTCLLKDIEIGRHCKIGGVLHQRIADDGRHVRVVNQENYLVSYLNHDTKVEK